MLEEERGAAARCSGTLEVFTRCFHVCLPGSILGPSASHQPARMRTTPLIAPPPLSACQPGTGVLTAPTRNPAKLKSRAVIGRRGVRTHKQHADWTVS